MGFLPQAEATTFSIADGIELLDNALPAAASVENDPNPTTNDNGTAERPPNPRGHLDRIADFIKALDRRGRRSINAATQCLSLHARRIVPTRSARGDGLLHDRSDLRRRLI